MRPVLINGDLWVIHKVSLASPLLIDRTGSLKIAVADGAAKEIYISETVVPSLLDAVVLHEIAHAITMSYGLLPYLRQGVPEDAWVRMEENAVGMMEQFGIEALALASSVLGRSVCINGLCASVDKHI